MFYYVLAMRGGWGDSVHDLKSGWLVFWPEKDPDYSAASESARKDDEHLELLLNDLREGSFSV